MRPLLINLIALFMLTLSTSCSVYRSSDRDDFDANGKARAPATAVVLTQEDRDLLANPCAAINAMTDSQLKTLFGPSPRLSMTNEVSPKTATCLITTGSTDLSVPSLFACSWKPVTGKPLPLDTRHGQGDQFSVQTTESELREQGFDVVTTTVLAGERLRMNCEAYAPTTAIIEDRRNGEPLANELNERFATFTHALADETLPTDLQH
jgi:hypothetical protein